MWCFLQGGGQNCSYVSVYTCDVVMARYRLLFEFPASGGVVPSADLAAVNYHHFTDDVGLLMLHMLLFCFLVYFIVDAFTVVRRTAFYQSRVLIASQLAVSGVGVRLKVGGKY